MKLLHAITEPEYAFRPLQIVRRLIARARPPVAPEPSPEDRAAERRPGAKGSATIQGQTVLPWGLPIRYRPTERIGEAIHRAGIYDLCVCEAIWRLLDRGEWAVDVGANIGQMSSVMAAAVGPAGRVLAYEPHPQVFAELACNARLWEDCPGAGCVRPIQRAVSSFTGTARLAEGEAFEHNRGTAALVPGGAAPGGVAHEVEVVRLDDVVGGAPAIGVMKIDVEGHELEVLRGAARLLARRRVRDILYEQLESASDVLGLLESHGYFVFRLHKQFWGPTAIPADQGLRPQECFEPLSCLATMRPERALQRLAPRGWRVLRPGRRPVR